MAGFDEIELSSAVRAVREQLAQAALEGAGSAVRFEVGPIQMEFAVEIRREVGGKGGVKAWVVSSEAEAKASSARTHRVAFTLTPRDGNSQGPYLIGDSEAAGTSRFGGSEG